jgi:hypothetical protein
VRDIPIEGTPSSHLRAGTDYGVPPSPGTLSRLDHGRILSLWEEPGDRNVKGFKEMLDIELVEEPCNAFRWCSAERDGG